MEGAGGGQCWFTQILGSNISGTEPLYKLKTVSIDVHNQLKITEYCVHFPTLFFYTENSKISY